MYSIVQYIKVYQFTITQSDHIYVPTIWFVIVFTHTNTHNRTHIHNLIHTQTT